MVASVAVVEHGMRIQSTSLKPVLNLLILLAGLILIVRPGAAHGQTGGDYELSWSSIDGGGGVDSATEDFRLSGTVAQEDAGASSGGDYTVLGGFLAGASEPPLFVDGFESGDLSAWSSSTGLKIVKTGHTLQVGARQVEGVFPDHQHPRHGAENERRDQTYK